MRRERARVASAVLVAVIFGVVFDWRVGVAFYAGSLWPTIVAPVLTPRAMREGTDHV